ncbi:hypothetical protein KUTeg_014551 [Tegillarca granosa]|uniref:Vacuolar protein sorting 13 homolog A n=1 Tax=Tegillarca granosa TaxID=220873 RepID=A0ABQ9ES97_TEGGR|nr:hypothetical protein KUTeg_014551 [Tegillarca granosa]
MPSFEMVFESLVVDLINKYLGDYVENLDRSQLKLGIWGGDAVLQNLDVKESALDDLDLPVKIKAGHIGKLTLKIPWKNLYTEPVVASIDGLYALAVPNIAVKYNEEKEEKAKQESKQKKLQQIEDAKKLELEKKWVGLKTTDENWKPCVVKEAVTHIFKLVKLDSLAVYWNSKSKLLNGQSRENILVSNNNYDRWKYAYTCVLEETVRRRHRMWSWSHISKHRKMMKQYREAYIKKLDSKKVSAETQKIIDECEKFLDVFNITIMRQQAEVEAAKLGAKKKEEKSGGWLGEDQFKELYTPEEKAKLYSAIGYEENEADSTLPKEYVAVRLVTKLTNVSLTVKDDTKNVEAKIDNFSMHGSPQNGNVPKMVLSQNQEADKVYSLLNVQAETNPLDGKCDTRVRVSARPLQIMYDAITVNQIVEFFKPPEQVYLNQNVKMLILDLGNLKVNSEKNQSASIKGKTLINMYHKFTASCENIRVTICDTTIEGEDWQSARKVGKSGMHILNPISINIVLQKCMFDKDPRMAKIKISGELPLLSLTVSDHKLMEIKELAEGIPLPESKPEDKTEIVFKANADGPEFTTTYKNTEQTISVTFTALEVLLHQEAILSLMEFAEALQPPPAKTPAKEEDKKKDEKDTQDKGEEEKKIDRPARRKKKKVDPDKIDILVNAKLDEFSVSVCTEEKLITDIKIKGIVAGVTLQEAKTCVKAELKAISILDPDPNTLYSMIMDIEGESVLNSKIIIYNGATDGDNYSNMSCVDTDVDVTLGCIRLFFLNKFVNDLLAFLNNFQTAKDKLKKAGDTMAEYSKEAVQRLQEKAPRVRLNINMDAPKIIVPQSSKSQNVLLADFGHLKIQNSFEMPGKNSASGFPAVLDLMGINLSDLKVTRAVIAPSGSIHGECRILEPISIKLDITRNLSIGWYKDRPEIDITGTMEAVMVTISQGDFTMLMLVLNENLTEGQPIPEKEVYVSMGRLTDDEVMESHILPPPTTAEPITCKEEPYQKMTFDFKIKSLSAALYTGQSDLSASGLTTRNPKASLGKIELQVIAVEGKMMSDNSMTTKVILKDTILDDTRPPKENGVTRMIERRCDQVNKSISEPSSSSSPNMIDVSFTQESNKDKNIDVKVCSLHICVCLDYLMSLSDFFIKGMPETKPKPVKQEETKAPPPPPPDSEMNIKVTVEKPDIILIEDQSNPASNALVLNTEVSFRMRVCPETQDMSATIKDLQIISCLFNKRQGGAQILNPCDISFYSKTPYGKGAHMDIATSDLILNISPATIKTMSAIAAGLSKSQDEGDQTKKDVVPADLWAIKKVTECNFWYLKTAETGDEAIIDPESIIAEEDIRGEQLIARVPTIVVKLEGGVGKRTVPLLIVEASFEGEVKNWSTKVCMNDDELPPPEEDAETVDLVMPPAKMVVNIRSQDALQLMVSKTCLEVLTNLGQVEEYNCTREIVIKRAEKRLYPINNKTFPGDLWSIVLSTDTNIGQRIVSLRSIVQVKNHLIVPVEVFSKGEKEVKSCGIVKPGEIFNLPLSAIYTPSGEFFYKPISQNGVDYKRSTEGFCWRDADKMETKQIGCEGDQGHSPFYICVRTETVNIFYDQTDEETAKTYIMHLSPTVILHNLLTVPIKFLLEGTSDNVELKKGENVALSHACVGKSNLEVMKRQKTIKSALAEPAHVVNTTIQPEEMDQYRAGIVMKDGKDKNDKEDKKKIKEWKQSGKATLKIGDTDWSDKFSLDTVGSAGSVQCKSKTRTYELTIACSEVGDADSWIEVNPGEHGGINVECQVTESAMVTTLCGYKSGMATVLLINHTDKASIQFQQSGVKTVHILGPDQCMLYTWEQATGKREMQWTCGDKKNQKNDLLQAGELERIEQEINVCIQGMGLSLVNDYKQTEVAFMGITSSGIIWEEKRKRYKALNLKSCASLETAYQKYMLELASGHNPAAKLHLDNKMEVNFADMMMLKPNKRQIRRSFQDGIWIQYKTSPHQVQLHAKINRLQIDNQISGAVFPTVLAPLPPPKSVAADSGKYFKVLIQEMTLKLDQGFLNNVIDLFASDKEVTREQETTMFIEDCKKVDVPLLEEVGLSLAEEQKNFYDHLHFSPIKLHLSFSLQGGGGDGKPTQIHSNVINIFLQSVGVVLTDVQDVVFKLGFFQRDHSFYNQSQLVGEMGRHYAGQGVFDGVTGIVRKPVEGAKKEGVEGFFKGVGKGLVGVVTRPTSGVIDFASSSFEGIRRIAEMSDEVRRLRPPRRFHADHVIRPYNLQEAEGYAILIETEKGRFAETDERVIYANRGEIFGHWDADWTYTWPEIKDDPKQTSKGLEIHLKWIVNKMVESKNRYQ